MAQEWPSIYKWQKVVNKHSNFLTPQWESYTVNPYGFPEGSQGIEPQLPTAGRHWLTVPFCLCESRSSKKMNGLSFTLHSHRVDVSHLTLRSPLLYQLLLPKASFTQVVWQHIVSCEPWVAPFLFQIFSEAMWWTAGGNPPRSYNAQIPILKELLPCGSTIVDGRQESFGM